MKPIILASTSPRRIELMKKLSIPFSLQSPEEVEISKGENPKELVLKNASLKAWSVANKIEEGVVIAADTVVVLNDEVLDKPSTKDKAIKMLKKLSGIWHDVLTGLSIVLIPEKREFRDLVRTKVKFKDLTDDEIDFYVSTGEPFDKAGGYAIQGYASLFVEELRGCYYNVVGLPLNRLYSLLLKAGVNLINYLESRR